MNVLLIAPYFAPSSEVPSVRMVSLSRHLVSMGHKVTVLCYSREMLLTMYKEAELSSTVPKGVKVIGFSCKSKRLPFISDILDGIQFKRDLPKLLKGESFDIALTTCGPYFTLKAMPMLKSKLKIPYVLDFRDLGALNYRPRLGNEEKPVFWKEIIKNIYKGIILRREKNAVLEAEHIICISEIDREKMQSAYGLKDEKLAVATNGYDEVKLNGMLPAEKTQGIKGAVFGKFMYYSRERASALLLAMDSLRKDGINISLIHIGITYPCILDCIKENDLDSGVYDPKGLKEYSEGMKLLGSADFFVVEDTSPDDVGTKIYDYIFWNKPIVAVTPEDIPLAKLIKSFKNGYVCQTKAEVESAIKDIIDRGLTVLDPNINTDKYARDCHLES